MEKESEQSSAVIADLQRKIDEIQNKQAEDSRAMLKLQKSTERYHAKRQMLTSRKEECNRNIRDLGVLPEEAFEKYTTELVDKVRTLCYDTYIERIAHIDLQLMKKLHKVNDGLKKFAHVNKKAFEQYNGFTKQRDQLLQRRDDLDTSAESIQELVEVLDQRKDEAIERTFKQVAKNFEEVFEALVPAGKGRLIIQKRIDQVTVYSVEFPFVSHRIILYRTRMLKLKLTTRSNHRWITILECQSRLAHHVYGKGKSLRLLRAGIV